MPHSSAVLERLGHLAYEGALLDEARLSEAVRDGTTSLEFVNLVSWLVAELKVFTPSLEENVHRQSGDSPDGAAFKVEVAGVLRELRCPHGGLTRAGGAGLENEPNRWLVLDYLLSEVQAAHMLAAQTDSTEEILDRARNLRLKNQTPAESVENSFRTILRTLKLSDPPAHVGTMQIFQKLESKVREGITHVPGGLGKPLLTDHLALDQWQKLEEINEEFEAEYSVRRQMLLKRLDVTVQSFQWSDRAKNKDDDVARLFREPRQLLGVTPNVRVADVLAARDSLIRICKTTSGSTQVSAAIKRVLIKHNIPDRGGRPNETRPEPEIPSWQQQPKDQRHHGGGGRGGRGGGGGAGGGHSHGHHGSNGAAGGASGYGGGGGHRGGRGGRVQGGWSGGRGGGGGGDWGGRRGGGGGGRGRY